MAHFKPTYLYIKQHNLTKLLYFGKTTLPHDKMLEYTGSGDRWLNHIKSHGIEHVSTIWYCLYYDKDECEKFALYFSHQENITESVNWANLIPENGYSGFPSGLTFSNNHKTRLSDAKKGKSWEEIYGTEGARIKREKNSQPKGPMNEGRKNNISKAKKGMKAPHLWSIESRNKVSNTMNGVKKSTTTIQNMRQAAKVLKTCPHCGLTGNGPSMQRWHFHNCKHK